VLDAAAASCGQGAGATAAAAMGAVVDEAAMLVHGLVDGAALVVEGAMVLRHGTTGSALAAGKVVAGVTVVEGLAVVGACPQGAGAAEACKVVEIDALNLLQGCTSGALSGMSKALWAVLVTRAVNSELSITSWI